MAWAGLILLETAEGTIEIRPILDISFDVFIWFEAEWEDRTWSHMSL